MRTLMLHGALGKEFGSKWELDVRTPSEALKAVQANRSDFFKYIVESDKKGVAYRLRLDERDISLGNMREPFGRETFHLVPVIGGSKDGLFSVVLGAALIGAMFIPVLNGFAATEIFSFSSLTWGSAITGLGVSLVLGGVSQMLTSTPQVDVSQSQDMRSYYFSGPQNTTAQGSAVPVGYGRVIVGSQPISSGIHAENF